MLEPLGLSRRNLELEGTEAIFPQIYLHEQATLSMFYVSTIFSTKK